ncbi:MAG: hypothetical protein CL678_13000 [Bdellovibrionaceae bacterium]|nr:hypothetical protein [Pseudobdellovibrionaceae bacterium]
MKLLVFLMSFHVFANENIEKRIECHAHCFYFNSDYGFSFDQGERSSFGKNKKIAWKRLQKKCNGTLVQKISRFSFFEEQFESYEHIQEWFPYMNWDSVYWYDSFERAGRKKVYTYRQQNSFEAWIADKNDGITCSVEEIEIEDVCYVNGECVLVP